jgi:steroid 5-alpha reductase family enzyme
MHAALLMLIGWALMFAMMTALWLIQRAKGDAGVVDVGWSAGLGIIAVFYAVFAGGDFSQRLLVGVLAGLWSLRLALYVYLNRVRGKEEDGRYQTLRAKWGDKARSPACSSSSRPRGCSTRLCRCRSWW